MTTLARTSPYLGPRPFADDDHDRARFFARDAEADEIVAMILGHPMSVVYAQSGAGKTSIFNAAVLPRLRNEGFTTLPLTRVSGGIPEGLDPARVSNPYVFNIIAGLAPDTEASALAPLSLTDFLTDSGDARVLVVDQFEEIFTQAAARDHAARHDFVSQLASAIAANPLLRVVLVLREEYIAQLEPYASLLPEKLRIRFRLERLDFQDALLAVTAPLEGTGCRYDTGVAERLVGELAKIKSVSLTGQSVQVAGGYVEPVQLQVACLGLWEALPPDAAVITAEHLDEFGDVDEALGRFYDSVLVTVAEEGFDERQVREWFSDTLITPLGTRGTVHRGETTGGLPNETADLLEAHHLVRVEYRSGARWYELTHDRLVEPIRKRNELWEQRLYSENPLAAGAVIWERLDRDDGSLLRGRQLEEAGSYADSPASSLTNLEMDYLEASLEERARRRRRRALYFVTLAALVAAVALALFAAWQWREADAAREEARASAVFAEEAKLEAEAARAEADRLRRTAEAAEAAAVVALEDTKVALEDAEAAEAAAVAAQTAAMEAEAAAMASEAAAVDALKDTEVALAEAKQAREEADALRLSAEAALRTSTARLDLLNRIAQEPNTLGGSVAANETATHAISIPADRDFIVASLGAIFLDDFSVDRARRADVDVTLTDFERGRTSSISETCFCASASQPASGLWVIEVSSPVAVTYEIGLSFDEPPTIRDLPTNGVATGSIDKLSDVDQWSFTGEEGQLVTVNVSPTPGSQLDPSVEILDPSVEILDPAGSSIGGASPGQGQVTTAAVQLPFSDKYIVTVQGIESPGSYEISISEITPRSIDQGRLSIGEGTTGIIEKAGESHLYRFEATAGTPIILQLVGDAFVDASFGLVVELEDPEGAIIAARAQGDPLLATIPADGTYVIRIRGADFGITGAYELETAESEIRDRGTLAVGGSGTAVIEDLEAVDRWRFDGVAGQGVRVEAKATADQFFPPTVEVLDPFGRPLGTQLFAVPQADVILPSDGEYVIQVRGDPFSLPPVSYEVELDALPIVDRGELASGDTGSGSIDEESQRDHWSFDGSEGETITIDVVATPGSSLDPFLGLLDPSGAIIAEDDDGGVDLNSQLTVTLPQDGEYVIEVRGFDGASRGAYEVSIS